MTSQTLSEFAPEGHEMRTVEAPGGLPSPHRLPAPTQIAQAVVLSSEAAGIRDSTPSYTRNPTRSMLLHMCRRVQSHTK